MLINKRTITPITNEALNCGAGTSCDIGILEKTKRVYVQFDRPTLVYALTPTEARELAASLDQCANLAEGRKTS